MLPVTTNRRCHILQIDGKTFSLNYKLFNLLTKKVRALGSSGIEAARRQPFRCPEVIRADHRSIVA